MSSLSISQLALYVPPYDEIQSVLCNGLKKNFADVSVNLVDCPNLTESPYHLAAPGLSGNPCLVDIGGPAHLLPLVQRDKIYNYKTISKLIELPAAFMIGAGAGPAHIIGVNSELINNVKYEADGSCKNKAYTAKVDTKTGGCILEQHGSEDFCLMGNFLCCQGWPGKVLEVKASKRTGSDDFVASLRKTLADFYEKKSVGLGGVFLLEQGKAHLHIMPDFSDIPLQSPEDVDNWLKFYDMDPTLVCVGELVSYDPGLDLRVEHFHCFNQKGQGGHYHWDTTPEEVVYRGYFVIPSQLYRIDEPVKTV